MPVVNPLTRELVFKIVYYGPGLGGKTTTLQYIHATTKAEHRGKMVSLATPVDRTLYFDFLPIRLPQVRNMGVRLQLFTVPGQVYYNATRRLVLTGADGIVFVADSQRGRLDANLESLSNLNENLREQDKSLGDVPHVIVYNKRDLYDIASIEELERQLDKHGAPSFATCASTGEGVYETLDAIARAVLEDFERRNPGGEGESLRALQVPEGGLTQALRSLDARPDSVPPQPRAQVPVEFGQPRSEAAASASGDEAKRAVAAASESVVSEPERADESSVSVTPASAPAIESALSAVSEPERADEPPVSVTPAPAPAGESPLQVEGSTPTSSGVGAAAPKEPTPTPPSPMPSTTLLGSVSFRSLWPDVEAAQVERLERALSEGHHAAAVEAADELVSRVLAGAAAALGNLSGVPRDPSIVVLLMGLDGRRYLEFRALVRDCRNGENVSLNQALAAYAFAVDARLARTRLSV